MCGFPHFKYVEFDGEFPIATLNFKDDNFPANVKMTAFNPFIPCDSKNSSIPAAFFEIEVNNITDEAVKYQIAFSVRNPYEVSRNKAEIKGDYRILTICNSGADKDSIEYGDLNVATDCEDTYTQEYWYRGRCQDSIVSFWNDFNNIENLKERAYDTDGKCDTGIIAAEVEVLPNEAKRVRFVLSWNVPNNYNYWDKDIDENKCHNQWKNYYATIFENSVSSAV